MDSNIKFSLLYVLYFSNLNIIENSICKLDDKEVEFILIDNSLSIDYWNLLKNWRRNLIRKMTNPSLLKLIRSDKNLGYGGGNNLGAKYSKGKYLIISNPDMIISNSFIYELNRITNKMDWGIISPKIYQNEDLKHIFSGLIDICIYWPFTLFYFYNYDKSDDNFSTHIYENFYAHGGFFIIRRDLFSKLHGFDTSYFMYTEEVDLCQRARILRESTIFYPKLIIFHNKEPPSQFTLNQMLKNNLIFIGNFYSIWTLIIQFCFSLFRIFYDRHYIKKKDPMIHYLRSIILGLKIGIIKNIVPTRKLNR